MVSPAISRPSFAILLLAMLFLEFIVPASKAWAGRGMVDLDQKSYLYVQRSAKLLGNIPTVGPFISAAAGIIFSSETDPNYKETHAIMEAQWRVYADQEVEKLYIRICNTEISGFKNDIEEIEKYKSTDFPTALESAKHLASSINHAMPKFESNAVELNGTTPVSYPAAPTLPYLFAAQNLHLDILAALMVYCKDDPARQLAYATRYNELLYKYKKTLKEEIEKACKERVALIELATGTNDAITTPDAMWRGNGGENSWVVRDYYFDRASKSGTGPNFLYYYSTPSQGGPLKSLVSLIKEGDHAPTGVTMYGNGYGAKAGDVPGEAVAQRILNEEKAKAMEKLNEETAGLNFNNRPEIGMLLGEYVNHGFVNNTKPDSTIKVKVVGAVAGADSEFMVPLEQFDRTLDEPPTEGYFTLHDSQRHNESPYAGMNNVGVTLNKYYHAHPKMNSNEEGPMMFFFTRSPKNGEYRWDAPNIPYPPDNDPQEQADEDY